MKLIFPFVFACLFTLPVAAQQAPEDPFDVLASEVFVEGTDVDLKQFLWKKRPLVVFADSPNDPQFIRQMELLTARLSPLAERDVVILTDTDPEADSALRERLHPRGFMLVLIVKDGTIYLRKPLPWDVREITRTIDKLPMRQQEMNDRRTGGS